MAYRRLKDGSCLPHLDVVDCVDCHQHSWRIAKRSGESCQRAGKTRPFRRAVVGERGGCARTQPGREYFSPARLSRRRHSQSSTHAPRDSPSRWSRAPTRRANDTPVFTNRCVKPLPWCGSARTCRDTEVGPCYLGAHGVCPFRCRRRGRPRAATAPTWLLQAGVAVARLAGGALIGAGSGGHRNTSAKACDRALKPSVCRGPSLSSWASL